MRQAIPQSLAKGFDTPKRFLQDSSWFVRNESGFCNIMHADTAGTKTSLAYNWKETGDISVWKGIVQDAMKDEYRDDMVCVGCVDYCLFQHN